MVSRMRRAIHALCLLGLFPCLLAAQDMEELKRLPPFERAIRLVMRYEGWHGPDKAPSSLTGTASSQVNNCPTG